MKTKKTMKLQKPQLDTKELLNIIKLQNKSMKYLKERVSIIETFIKQHIDHHIKSSENMIDVLTKMGDKC